MGKVRYPWSLPPLAVCVMAGCATPAPRLSGAPYLDDDAHPTVVLGYFTEPKNLGIASCPESGDPDVSIDCFGPYPSVTLVVQEVLFGKLQEARLELLAYDVKHPERFPLGPRHPVLVYPDLYGVGAFQALARTRSGDWALPVGAGIDLPNLPCDAQDALVPRALDFAHPHPQRPLDEYRPDDRAAVESNPQVSVRDGVASYHAGILLDDIYRLREQLPSMRSRQDLDLDPCFRK